MEKIIRRFTKVALPTLRLFCLFILLFGIAYLTGISVKPVPMAGGWSFSPPVERFAILLVALLSLLVLDFGSRLLKISKIPLGLALSASISIPLHLQLSVTPYDCNGFGCGVMDGVLPADPSQFLFLLWLALWFLLCPAYQRLMGDFRSVNHWKYLFYSMTTSALITLLMRSYCYLFPNNADSPFINICLFFTPTLALADFTSVAGVIGLIKGGLILLIQVVLVGLVIYFAAVQGRHRWVFAIFLSVALYFFGDPVVRMFYT